MRRITDPLPDARIILRRCTACRGGCSSDDRGPTDAGEQLTGPDVPVVTLSGSGHDGHGRHAGEAVGEQRFSRSPLRVGMAITLVAAR
jgi:hypothetical protein